MYKVTVRGPDGSETHYPLGTDQGLIIGRDESADIVLTSKRVSRRHARLYTSGTQLHIEDLESQNGVFVGGARISGTAEFRAGPPIEIGEFSIRVKREDPLAAENSYSGLLQGYGPWEGKSLELPKTKAFVGRDSSADLVIPSESVSRKHAEIRFAGAQGYYVQDLGSSNGTFINGARLPANAERPLRPNDRVNFGDTGWLVAPQGASEKKEEAQSNRRSFLRFVIAAVLFLGLVVAAISLIPKDVQKPDAGPEGVASAFDRCQQAIADENWPQAMKDCHEAYDEEPFVERRKDLRKSKREVAFKTIFDQCMTKAQVGADREAMDCFFGIEQESYYFAKAKLQVHQLSTRLMKSDESACHAAMRDKKVDKILQHCRDFLQIQCHNGVDKDVLAALRKAEATKKDVAPWECDVAPWECQASQDVWFKSGVTEHYRREDYCDKNEETNICDGLLAYAQKKQQDALKAFSKAQTKNTDRINMLKETVANASGKYSEGMSLTQGNRWTAADEAFRVVMDADAHIMKEGVESDYVKDIRLKMGEHYQTTGDEAQAPPGKHYDDAFKAYKTGMFYRPTLEQNLQGLEKIADEILSNQPTCDRVPTIFVFTRPESAEYQEATKWMKEHCGK